MRSKWLQLVWFNSVTCFVRKISFLTDSMLLYLLKRVWGWARMFALRNCCGQLRLSEVSFSFTAKTCSMLILKHCYNSNLRNCVDDCISHPKKAPSIIICNVNPHTFFQRWNFTTKSATATERTAHCFLYNCKHVTNFTPTQSFWSVW